MAANENPKGVAYHYLINKITSKHDYKILCFFYLCGVNPVALFMYAI
jgi:hypothetical protein